MIPEKNGHCIDLKGIFVEYVRKPRRPLQIRRSTGFETRTAAPTARESDTELSILHWVRVVFLHTSCLSTISKSQGKNNYDTQWREPGLDLFKYLSFYFFRPRKSRHNQKQSCAAVDYWWTPRRRTLSIFRLRLALTPNRVLRYSATLKM